MRCYAPFCKTTAETISGSAAVTLHEFPSDSHLRAAWLRALGRQDTPLPDSSVVCSQHFLKDEFYETEFGSRQICAGAIPSTVQVYKDISKTLNYEVKGKPKAVVYWLAKLKNPDQKVTLSDEHQDLKWLPLEKAQEVSGFKDMHELLAEFHEKALKLV